ncbi:MAG: hypothetical protein S4CHLAM81_04010 [Chlamydiales bacterium]|nr:hypothetical protein [Chlamydiales bacterium]MCH9635190.1 hypothetical protein [Chlamydiales bacterium]MCH9704270.1 Cof-type HAD-IIB family hydrolase [Chlamydiota bacterium]
MNGIIALDIDGTITKSHDTLHPEVVLYLNSLIEKGYHLVFITGRTFAFAHPIFEHLRGSFYVGVQNGAALYKMPEQKQLFRHYVSGQMVPKLEELFAAIERPLLLEMGHEHLDLCYYKRADFSEEDMEYIRYRQTISKNEWRAVTSFADLKIESCAVAKYFAGKEVAHQIADQLHGELGLNTIVINDAFKPGSFLAHVNSSEASKGRALAQFHDYLGQKLPVLAAGDDYNDLAMLLESDYKVVVSGAPADLLKIADVVAKPPEELGIIEAIDGWISKNS